MRRLAAALGVLLLAGTAQGHGRSTSTSSWSLGADGARVQVRVPLADLQRALPELAGVTPEALAARPGLREAAGRYLSQHLRLEAGGAGCSPAGPLRDLPSPDPTHVGFAWRLECPRAGPYVLSVDLFLEVRPAHLHLARIAAPGDRVHERVFVLDSSRYELPGPEAASAQAPGSGFVDYLELGIRHIASGADHLLFLLALLLLGASLAELATIVSGFTVAHSVTLALGVLGVVEPRQAVIEALIGLSVAVVALENFALTMSPSGRRGVLRLLAAGTALAAGAALLGWVALPASALAGVGLFSVCYLGLLERAARPARLRWLVAFVFGLVHGFGFAGLLAEIGLPPDRLAAALLGFNLGVEVGQLAALALAWPLLRLALGGSPGRRALVIQLASAPVLAAGLYWFLTRGLSS